MTFSCSRVNLIIKGCFIQSNSTFSVTGNILACDDNLQLKGKNAL